MTRFYLNAVLLFLGAASGVAVHMAIANPTSLLWAVSAGVLVSQTISLAITHAAITVFAHQQEHK